MKHTTNKIDQNPLTALAINEDPITKRQQPQNGCDSGPCAKVSGITPNQAYNINAKPEIISTILFSSLSGVSLTSGSEGL